MAPAPSLSHSRYQRGCVFKRGKKKQVWYGKFREDVRTPEGIERRQRLVRLGAATELPTKSSARDKLMEFLNGGSTAAVMDITFRELAERWEKAEGPTMKVSTLDRYKSTLRAYILPRFGDHKIASISREHLQGFLAEQAKTYSASILRSIRVVFSLTLGWALNCGWLEKNPCLKVKLPVRAGGRKVMRTVLTAQQVCDIAWKLEEPYATLVLFLAATGLRIGEAIAVKWSDFSGNVLTVSRRIYYGEIDTVKSAKSQRRLPLNPTVLERIRLLGEGKEWVFRSTTGTPVNPGNALKRYIHSAAKACGIRIGGWHDFRHTLCTSLRRSGVHPKVVSDILGHARVNLAMDVYDRTDVSDLEQPLTAFSEQLVSSGIKSGSAA